MSMAADYVVPQQHEAILRKMLLLEVGPELPLDLKKAYLRRRRLADRGGLRLGETDLIEVALDYGLGLPEEDEPQDFMDVLKENTVHLGTNVEVKWRFGKHVPGKYQGTKNQKVLVLLDDGTGEVRQIDPAKVKLAG